MRIQEEITEKRVCKNCGHWNEKVRACQNWAQFNRMRSIPAPDTTVCEAHATENEKLAAGVISSGVECAKDAVKHSSVEVLSLALRMETTGMNRKGIIKMIEVQIRKAAKNGK